MKAEKFNKWRMYLNKESYEWIKKKYMFTERKIFINEFITKKWKRRKWKKMEIIKEECKCLKWSVNTNFWKTWKNIGIKIEMKQWRRLKKKAARIKREKDKVGRKKTNTKRVEASNLVFWRIYLKNWWKWRYQCR